MSVQRLQELIFQKKNPTVLGLDPRLDYLPPALLNPVLSEQGETLEAAAQAVWQFNKGLIDVLSDCIPAVKLQSACYEMLGAPGFALLIRTVHYARQAGLYVIVDAKRGDIGSTSEAYSAAFLGRVTVGQTVIAPVDADALTVNPYLGSDNTDPFVRDCKAYDKMIFVLGRTSNPSSAELQELDAEGLPLYHRVALLVERWGKGTETSCGYSAVGLVVGATHPEQTRVLRGLLPNTFFLVPGFGAQGGTARDVKWAFDEKGGGALVNNSRGLMCAWQKDGGVSSFADASRAAALRMKEQLGEALGQ